VGYPCDEIRPEEKEQTYEVKEAERRWDIVRIEVR